MTITKEQDAKMKAERLVQLKAQHPDGNHEELRAIGRVGEDSEYTIEPPVASAAPKAVVSSTSGTKNAPTGLQTPENDSRVSSVKQ